MDDWLKDENGWKDWLKLKHTRKLSTSNYVWFNYLKVEHGWDWLKDEHGCEG